MNSPGYTGSVKNICVMFKKIAEILPAHSNKSTSGYSDRPEIQTETLMSKN